jgi:phage-related protein
MDKSLWRIEGFVTAAGSPVVQKWFWNEIGIEERDALRDRMNHLTMVEKHLWKEPLFEWFGDIGEVKKRVSTGALRVYGYYPDDSNTFVFLLGVVKKRTKDREGMELARKRLKRLKNREGSTHEFNFEERTSSEDSAEQEDQGSTGGIKSLGGYRFPN